VPPGAGQGRGDGHPPRRDATGHGRCAAARLRARDRAPPAPPVSAPPTYRPATLPSPAAIQKAVEQGHDVNEVEGAGNTPLHNAAWAGWLEGVELLLDLGAKADASNNAGDRPYHL